MAWQHAHAIKNERKLPLTFSTHHCLKNFSSYLHKSSHTETHQKQHSFSYKPCENHFPSIMAHTHKHSAIIACLNFFNIFSSSSVTYCALAMQPRAKHLYDRKKNFYEIKYKRRKNSC